MRKNKLVIPKMHDAKPTLSHIVRSVIPSKQNEDNRMNWHNCDKMSSVGEMGAGGGS